MVVSSSLGDNVNESTLVIAFIFPGQGSQFVGMGKAFYDADDEAKAVFHQATHVLGFDVERLCFHGPADTLNSTEYTQPAILTVSTIALQALVRAGVRPSVVAGHSLGEWSAVVAAGGISFEHALQLVRKRGRYMQEAVRPEDGLVAAILGPTREDIDRVCEAASEKGLVRPANYNTPQQTVIAGESSAVEEALRLIQDRHLGRSVRLPISVPVHTPLMTIAAERLASDLDAIFIHDLSVPLVNNVEAKPIRTGDHVKRSLLAQLPSPVLWEDSIKTLVRMGVRTMVEVGPGSVLSRMMGKIVEEMEVFSVQAPENIPRLVEWLADVPPMQRIGTPQARSTTHNPAQ